MELAASISGVLRHRARTEDIRHARAFVCGALASMVGHAEIYVSGGAEHQGPDGAGPVALIVDRGLAYGENNFESAMRSICAKAGHPPTRNSLHYDKPIALGSCA